MTNLEEKKKLLVAESEVYRQLLKLELQTFKVYGKRTRRKLTSVSTYLPAVMSSLPFLAGMFVRKKGKSSGSSLQRMGSCCCSAGKPTSASDRCSAKHFSGRNRHPGPPPKNTSRKDSDYE